MEIPEPVTEAALRRYEQDTAFKAAKFGRRMRMSRGRRYVFWWHKAGRRLLVKIVAKRVGRRRAAPRAHNRLGG